MAIELATAYVSVVPSVRGIQGELQRHLVAPAAQQGRQAGDRAGRGFHDGYAGWIQRIVAVTAAAGIGAAVAKISSAGIKGAANLETLTTAFTSLLGSSKAATVEITQLQAFAAKTPFSQQDVFGYAQQYLSLANSIGLAKDQVQPFLTTIGNIAAVTGASTENIHNAVLAIGQIGSAGKVTLDNLNQISEAFPGFNGAAAIASATGQTTAQVMKEISSGSIDAKTGVQALLKGMQDFPGAANAMVKQSQTLSGVWSTFKDTIQISLTQAFQPLVPTIKKVLSDLTPVISSVLGTFAPAIATFAQQIVPLLQPLLGGLSTVFASVFQALGPALAALAPVIQPLAAAFAQLVQAVSPLLTFAAQIVAQVGPPLLAVFRDLLTAVQPLISAFVSSFQPVLPVIAQALAQIGQALAPVVAALAGALAPVLPFVAQAFADLAQALAPIAAVLGQALVDMITAIAPSLPSLAQSFGSIAKSVAQLLTALAPVISLFSKLSSMGLPLLFESMAAPLKVVVEAFQDLATAGDVLSTSIGTVGNLGGTVTGGIVLAGDAAKTAGTDFVAMAVQALEAKYALAQVGLGAQVTAQDVLSVTNSIIAMADAIAAARGQAALALGLSAVAQAQAIADAAKGSAGTGLTLPSLTNPTLGAAAANKPPAFDVSTLTSFLSTAGLTKNPLTDALNAIFASARAAGKTLSNGLVNQLKSQNSELIGLTNQRDKIAQKLQTAQQKLADLIQQRNQEASTIKQAVTGTFNVGAIPKPQYGEPITLRDIMRRLNKAVANARSFNSVLRRLARAGLPSGLLQQLAEAGPDALPAARALLTASPKQLKEIKSQFRELTRQGSSIGRFVADDMYKSGIDAARGIVRGLRSQQSALNKAIRDLAKSMVKELRDQLGIHSPSTVLHELGAFSGEGFAQGLASKTSAVQSSAALLANGALPRSQAAVWAGRAGTAGMNVTVHQTIQNPLPEVPSVSGPAAIRRAAYALDR